MNATEYAQSRPRATSTQTKKQTKQSSPQQPLKQSGKPRRIIRKGVRKRTINESAIIIHPLARALPPLSDIELETLRNDIIHKDGTVHLDTKILIDAQGRVVDGRHRASILKAAGQESELLRQISARSGEWIELLQEDSSALAVVFNKQAGRRNCPLWRIYLALLPEYDMAIEEDKRTRNEQGSSAPASRASSLRTHFEVSKARLSEVRLIREYADESEVNDPNVAFSTLLKICRTRKSQAVAKHSDKNRTKQAQSTKVRTPNPHRRGDDPVKAVANQLANLFTKCSPEKKHANAIQLGKLLQKNGLQEYLLQHWSPETAS